MDGWMDWNRASAQAHTCCLCRSPSPLAAASHGAGTGCAAVGAGGAAAAGVGGSALLHCADVQQGTLLSDVFGRRHYGLDPGNVIIMAQPAWPAHRFDPASQRWQRDPLAACHSLGSGYAMFLMSWVGEGLTLSADGQLLPLKTSVVEALEARGVK